MYFITGFIYIAACVSAVYCAAALMPTTVKPAEKADQEGCYEPSLNRILVYNTTYSPEHGGTCIQYTCLLNNHIRIDKCSSITVVNIPQDCELVPGDKLRPFPECCDRELCYEIDIEDWR